MITEVSYSPTRPHRGIHDPDPRHPVPTIPAREDVPGFSVDGWIRPEQPPTLVLTGEIDIVAVPAIVAATTRLLDAASGRLDNVIAARLGQVTFLDCAALGAIVGLQKRIGSAGGRFVLEDVSQPALRLLTLTRRTHHLLPGSAELPASLR